MRSCKSVRVAVVAFVPDPHSFVPTGKKKIASPPAPLVAFIQQNLSHRRRPHCIRMYVTFTYITHTHTQNISKSATKHLNLDPITVFFLCVQNESQCERV